MSRLGRWVSGLVWIAAFTTAALLSGCVGDSFAEYTVVNDTDQDLLTWATTHGCDAGVGNKEDYTDAELVPRHSTFHYGKANFETLRCTYVATIDRRIVLTDERTNHGATFTITEPVSPHGGPVPEADQLPGRTWPDNFPWRSPLLWAVAALFAAGILTFVSLSALAVFRRHVPRHDA